METKRLKEAMEDPKTLKRVYAHALERAKVVSEQSKVALHTVLGVQDEGSSSGTTEAPADTVTELTA